MRGENEMERDSDRDGETDTESKTALRRKFDMKSREWGGEVLTGVMSRHMEICSEVLRNKMIGQTPHSSPLLSEGIYTSRSIAAQGVQM